MRISDAQIKAAILHPESSVRRCAVEYFALSGSTDPDLMPAVIDSIATHGRAETLPSLAWAFLLPQSAMSVDWAISELFLAHQSDDEEYAAALRGILEHADAHLLKGKETALLAAEHPRTSLVDAVRERIELISWSEDQCWQHLDQLCEECRVERDISDDAIAQACYLVEALSRFDSRCEARVLKLLAMDAREFDENPLAWLEPLAIRLAGALRLDAAIPSLIGRLGEGSAHLVPECTRALIRIGSPAVLESIEARYAQAEPFERMALAEILERIPGDATVAIIHRLLACENSEGPRYFLLGGLLSQFSQEGIPLVRDALLSAGEDPSQEHYDLRGRLLDACAVMGETFPECDAWRAEADLLQPVGVEGRRASLACDSDRQPRSLPVSASTLPG